MIVLLTLLAYLIGSISSAVLVARATSMPDPRTVGSGNPGATNILRQGNKSAAAITLLGDVLKGVIPVLIARALSSDPLLLAVVGAAAFFGHLFPIWFRFKGGKGVATAFGVFAALSPWVGLALAATWVLIAAGLRYSSLAALLTAALAPVYVWWWLGAAQYVLMAVVVAAVLIWRHRTNIQRLLRGEEDKIKLG